ncbi:unnamed protein product [Pleuronectes platessa]|uniref:Uncharacterized protein n=1 Tax=Pleuronectes platessa TaxID=8262 RepID=A0A9N7YPH5_PLEPL|nr:unnamed protein product [Pleuronectes platessa]
MRTGDGGGTGTFPLTLWNNLPEDISVGEFRRQRGAWPAEGAALELGAHSVETIDLSFITRSQICRFNEVRLFYPELKLMLLLVLFKPERQSHLPPPEAAAEGVISRRRRQEEKESGGGKDRDCDGLIAADRSESGSGATQVRRGDLLEVLSVLRCNDSL